MKTIETMRLPRSAARRPAHGRRAGVVLAIVLGTMVVATMLLALWARSVIRAHRQQTIYAHQLQAGWLVEAGIERAVARLAGSEDYSGETWNITAHELGGPVGATVNIRVEPVEELPEQRRIRVRADCPDDAVHRARRSKQILVDLARLRGNP